MREKTFKIPENKEECKEIKCVDCLYSIILGCENLDTKAKDFKKLDF